MNWSPTGAHFAITQQRQLLIYDSYEDDNPIEVDILLGSDSLVVWSPDGTQLAIVNWRDGQIYLVGVDGTILRQLTNDGQVYRLLG